jgi:hypothetical protein
VEFWRAGACCFVPSIILREFLEGRRPRRPQVRMLRFDPNGWPYTTGEAARTSADTPSA